MYTMEDALQEVREQEEYEKNRPLLPAILEDIIYMTKHASEYVGQKILFRGQGDKDFDVEPSLFHQNLIRKESELIRELTLQAPEDFTGKDSIFEKMIKMQHYGLPTRLLDMTLNPLVALYFACKDDTCKKKDGEILILLEYLEQPDSERVKWLCELSEYNDNDEIAFLEFLYQRNFIKEVNDAGNVKIIENYLGNKYLAVASPRNNERIKRQYGAFLLFGIDLAKQGNYYTKEKFKIKTELAQKSIKSNIMQNIIIEAHLKEQILKELDYIGINKGFLFPELEHQAEYIKIKHKTGE